MFELKWNNFGSLSNFENLLINLVFFIILNDQFDNFDSFGHVLIVIDYWQFRRLYCNFYPNEKITILIILFILTFMPISTILTILVIW